VRLLFRSSLLPADRQRLGARRLMLVIAAAATLSAGLLAAFAGPAGAVVVEPIAGKKIGIQKHNAATLGEAGSPQTFSNPLGNPVLHKVVTYAIYWDPEDIYNGAWQHVINTFLENLGVAGASLEIVFAVDTQYTDKSNMPATDKSTFAGAYTDTNPYPAKGCTEPKIEPDAVTCLTDTQIREQLQTFVTSQHALQKGMGTIFYLLTPPGVTVCADPAASICSSNVGPTNSLCSYHSDISTSSPETGDANTYLYAVIPWIAGGLGNPHLEDQAAAYECQDGGFDPSSKPKAEKKESKPDQQEPNQPTTCPSFDGGCDTGLADVIVNQIAVEQQNTVTDPLLNAWRDSGPLPRNEATDECRNVFALVQGGDVTEGSFSEAGTLFNQTLGTGSYYLNDAFNLAAYKRLLYPGVGCLTGVNLLPTFTAPTPVNAGELVGFDGMESTIDLGAGTNFTAGGAVQPTYATYTWNFGDGSPTVSGFAPGAPVCSVSSWLSPCAASVFHSYEYGGTYPVTLTVTDIGGNTRESAPQLVTVAGLPRPGSGGSSGGSGGSPAGGSPGGSPGGSSAGSATPGSTSAPVASAATLSRSLKSALSGGLVVRYSVNQQVAGRFEVLLAASIARRIGLHGPAATGLATGTAPQIVIAKAILVTTKGGQNTVKIKFSTNTAARLRRLHKVSLMVRLLVRGASPSSPSSTSSVSVVTLTH
jgi:hypothetical protein